MSEQPPEPELPLDQPPERKEPERKEPDRTATVIQATSLPEERLPSEKTRAAAERIIKALAAKGGESPVCPICRHNVWTIGAYVPIFVTPNVNRPSLGGPTYPFIALICVTCGNTHLINLMQLGFKQGELDGLAFDELPGV